MHLSTSYLLSSFVIGGAVAYNHLTTNSTCNILSIYLPDDVFFPESDTYNTTVESYPFIQLRLHPTCVVRPKSAQDVATVIHAIQGSKDTKFAIKGGGHNANAGFNNVEDGVTIDMQSLKAVEVGDETVSVEAGALSQDVYDALDPYNRTALAGRIGVVGVGGFLTGGGISFLSPKVGWACDNIVNFEVVLASGEIVNANATSRADLFKALKGGQNNFGIVTRFDLKTYPLGEIWGGRIAYSPDSDKDLVQAFTDFKNPANFDPDAAGWMTFRYNGSTKQVTPTIIMWYTDLEQKPGALANMTSVKGQVMNGMTVGHPGAFTKNASMVVKISNSRTIWATTSLRVSPTILHRIYDTWKSLIPKVCETYPGIASELTFQSLAAPPQNGSAPNSLGLSPDEMPGKDGIFLQILFYFQEAGYNEGLQNALKDFIKIFDDLAKEEGVHNKYIYLNFAARFQDPLAGYGEESVKSLQRVSRKYDPAGVFQKQLAGGFKLFTGNRTY